MDRKILLENVAAVLRVLIQLPPTVKLFIIIVIIIVVVVVVVAVVAVVIKYITLSNQSHKKLKKAAIGLVLKILSLESCEFLLFLFSLLRKRPTMWTNYNSHKTWHPLLNGLFTTNRLYHWQCLADLPQTPDTGMNDLPSSQQSPTSDATPLRAQCFEKFISHQLGLSKPTLP